MNAWIRRSLQVSAVAGGIVLAGAAAAQADTLNSEDNLGLLNGNQASLDNVNVPVNVSGNGVAGIGDAIGAGDGSAHAVNKSASNGDVLNSEENIGLLNGNQANLDNVNVPVNISGNGVAVIGDAIGAGDGQSSAVNKSASAHNGSNDGDVLNSEDNVGVLNGNQLDVDNVNVPVNVSGNGIAGIGDAIGAGDGEASAVNKSAHDGDVLNSEDNLGVLNGNQANLGNINVPVNVSGNGIAVIGDAIGAGDGEASAVNKSASAHNDSNDHAAGDVLNSDGNIGVLNGNQADLGNINVPVNVSGNGVSVIGDAIGAGDGEASAVNKSAHDGDVLNSEDNIGLGNGNQLDVDNINIPVNISGNGISVIGDAIGAGDGAAHASNR